MATHHWRRRDQDLRRLGSGQGGRQQGQGGQGANAGTSERASVNPERERELLAKAITDSIGDSGQGGTTINEFNFSNNQMLTNDPESMRRFTEGFRRELESQGVVL